MAGETNSGERLYVVLEQTEENLYAYAGRYAASSARRAIALHAETFDETVVGIQAVAVPARSWSPILVRRKHVVETELVELPDHEEVFGEKG